MSAALFDALLVLTIVALAWRALADPDLFRAVIRFIAMGLMMAVAWIRLQAPDVALAEAAVGSALTGALVLSGLARMKGSRAARRDCSGAATFALGLLALVLLAVVGAAALSLPAPGGLTAEALGALPRSGVTNPVTAALLNYRGYDTLLEVAVLLLAVIAVWSLDVAWTGGADLERSPMLAMLLRLVLPILVVAAGYLLWIGAFAPGGAFQGGALLAGGGVLALLGGLGKRLARHERALRAGLAAGLLVFAGVAGGTLGVTGELVGYPEASAKWWILLIESAALVSIGLTLASLYLGGRPGGLDAATGSGNPESTAHD